VERLSEWLPIVVGLAVLVAAVTVPFACYHPHGPLPANHFYEDTRDPNVPFQWQEHK